MNEAAQVTTLTWQEVKEKGDAFFLSVHAPTSTSLPTQDKRRIPNLPEMPNFGLAALEPKKNIELHRKWIQKVLHLNPKTGTVGEYSFFLLCIV